ncbi:MAG: hypothetical protein MHM6MM_001778 [Cercozoa sp. M6MM]
MSVSEIFESMGASLQERAETKEKLQVHVRAVSDIARTASVRMQAMHRSNIEQLKELGKSVCETVFPPLGELWLQIILTVGENQAEWEGMWRSPLSQLISAAALAHFARTRSLCTLSELSAMLHIPETGPAIKEEDYLAGVASLPAELARYCVNCVTHGDFDTPGVISDFVNDLYAGFQLLNYKNDNLRRKFDSMKYAIKQIESVLYDISIRKLRDQEGMRDEN